MKKNTFILLLFLVSFYSQAQTITLQNEDCLDQQISKEEAHEMIKMAAFSLIGPHFDRSLQKAIELAKNDPEGFANRPATCFAPDTDPKVVEAFYKNRNAIENSLGLPGMGQNSRFNLGARWSSTASNGGGLGQGDITTLTWSYAPDGTPIGNGGCQVPDIGGNSNFISFFNGIYGPPTVSGDFTTAPWHNIFVNMFNSWSSVSGLIFVYEPNDDGVTVVTGGSGIVGVRGDMRISGHAVDGNSNVLACNYFPNNGDMIIDTADNWFSNNSGTGTTNVLTHEIGHGVGLRHVCPVNTTKLMEPFVTTAFLGPQQDDILATNRHYGDPDGTNDTSASASFLGANAPPTSYSKMQRSIDDNGDTDYFSFTVSGSTVLSGVLTPTGTSYLSGVQNSNGSCSSGSVFNALTVADLMLEVLDTDGVTILATGAANGPGIAETLSGVNLPLAGTYFVRVGQQGASIDNSQMYDLDLNLASGGTDNPPNAICINFTAQLDAAGSAAITATNVDGGSSDAEGGVTLSVSPNTFTCAELGNNTVTLTVTDSAGQTDTCTATVTVVDSLGPVWTNPGVTIPALLDATGSIILGINDADAIITATDNCDPTIGITILGDAAARTFTCSDLGTNPTVQVRLRDNTPGVSGDNDTIITVGVDLQDNISPIISCVTNDTRSTDSGDCEYIVVGTEFDSTFTDNCSNGSIVNDLNATNTIAGAILPKGDTTVVWTVDDGNGQIVTCTTVITVVDNEDPVITCAPSDTRNTDPGECEYTVVGGEFDSTFTDNCSDGTITNDFNNLSSLAGNVFPNGVTTIGWTVDDGNGQIVTCTTVITVEDNEPATAVCQDITIQLDTNGDAMIVAADVDGGSTDNCGIASIAIDIDTFTCSDVGLNDVTLTVTDVNGNTSTCVSVATVEDLIAPEVTCPADQTVDAGQGDLYEVPDYFATGEATASDNCTSPLTILSQDPVVGTQLPVGIYTITINAEDEYGNIGTCTFELTVDFVLGVDDIELNLGSIVMHPNPVKDFVILSNPQSIGLKQATIYDLTGRLIQAIDLTTMGTETTIDISFLDTALYFVVIQTEKGQIAKQLLKE